MTRALQLAAGAAAIALAAAAQAAEPAGGLTPAEILKPAPDSWPTYSGDYSGRRYSPLAQINQANVRNLKLAFTAKVSTDPAGAMVGGDTPSAPMSSR